MKIEEAVALVNGQITATEALRKAREILAENPEFIDDTGFQRAVRSALYNMDQRRNSALEKLIQGLTENDRERARKILYPKSMYL